jgi:hypothetical protein
VYHNGAGLKSVSLSKSKQQSNPRILMRARWHMPGKGVVNRRTRCIKQNMGWAKSVLWVFFGICQVLATASARKPKESRNRHRRPWLKRSFIASCRHGLKHIRVISLWGLLTRGWPLKAGCLRSRLNCTLCTLPRKGLVRKKSFRHYVSSVLCNRFILGH